MTKRLPLCAAPLALLLSLTAHAIPGDVDLDGAVDERDLELLRRHVDGSAFLPAGPPQDHADVAPVGAAGPEPDGAIDERDLSVLIQALGDPDYDGDGLPSAFEARAGTSPLVAATDGATSDGARDDDGDGLDSLAELNAGTHPLLADTDADGVPDDVEVPDPGLDPTLVECEHLVNFSWPASEQPPLAVVIVGATQEAHEYPHCLAAGEIRGTKTAIQFHVRLPAYETWRDAGGKRLLFEGNGGYAGENQLFSASFGLPSVGVATDTGHPGPGIGWASGDPEAIVNYAYQAVHDTTRVARLLVPHYYAGRSGVESPEPAYTYLIGCSRGGGESITEAWRFGEDPLFDGLMAGAPAFNFTGLTLVWAAIQSELHPVPGVSADRYLSSVQLATLDQTITALCDDLDGPGSFELVDGLVTNPEACPFTSADLPAVCGNNIDPCFDAAQKAAIDRIFSDDPAGVKDAGGDWPAGVFAHGFPPGIGGGTGNWLTWIFGKLMLPGAAPAQYGVRAHFQNIVYGNEYAGVDLYPPPANETFEFQDFDLANFASDVQYVESNLILDVKDADLTSYQQAGGKLLLYHGWNDPATSAFNTRRYYDEMLAHMSEADRQGFSRLFLVPGMTHCTYPLVANGTGLTVDAVTGFTIEAALQRALFEWVEDGAAPASVIGESPAGGYTRPICAYPKVALYDGAGDPDDAASFSCECPPGYAPPIPGFQECPAP